ncbi:MAG TPA: sterol desaturase family protein [Thermoanaerobaculia bacterium]|jgi:sterol desaturase/sphingolipid hydroxylase (fatty acid hydroxylase superfamily)
MNRRRGGLIVFGVIAIVMVAERVWPLRKRREESTRHVARDAVMAMMSTAATAAVQSVILKPALESLPSRRQPLRVIAQILMLDYTLWLWHWLNHQIPLLWRFHRVHHVDLDLDAATGARFHFGEMSLSVFFRLLQVRVIRPDPLALSIWQTMLLSSIFFHHSNTRLPENVDRAVAQVFVTPRMHGIHHSTAADETNSNFASLLTIWDAMHGVLRLDVPQDAITIGVPAYQDPEDVTIDRLIVMPLRDTDADWTA